MVAVAPHIWGEFFLEFAGFRSKRLLYCTLTFSKNLYSQQKILAIDMDALRTTIWVGVLLALAAPLPAQEETPAPAANSSGPAQALPVADQVKAWARRLDADTLQERQRAEEKLLELGPAALAHLPEIQPNTAAETKARLERIRGVLQQQRADSVAKASTLTLSVKDVPLAQVVEAIEQQTGNRLIDFRRNFGQQAEATKVSVDWNSKPFWPAVDELLAQAGLEAYHYVGQEGVLAYVGRQAGSAETNPLVRYSEIFRFEPTRVESFLNLSDRSQRGTFLNLQVAWEPRTSPIVLKLPLDQLEVVDESGNNLVGEQRSGSIDTQVLPDVSAIDINLPLGNVSRDSQKIARLKGQLEALLPGRLETFTFDNLETARSVRQAKAGIEVVLDSFRRNGDIWEARVLFRVPNEQGALQSHLSWFYNNEAYLTGPDGERINHAGTEEYDRDVDMVGISYKFVTEHEAGDLELIYRSPASILTLPVTFELTDIPLP